MVQGTLLLVTKVRDQQGYRGQWTQIALGFQEALVSFKQESGPMPLVASKIPLRLSRG